jgi:hypothetical protein
LVVASGAHVCIAPWRGDRAGWEGSFRRRIAWLRVVAIREAWTQSARARAETPAGDFCTPYACELAPSEHPEPPAGTRDVAEQVVARIQHAQRLHDLATIKPNDRRALYLQGLGYRYREIAKLSRAAGVVAAMAARIDRRRHVADVNSSCRGAVVARVMRDHRAKATGGPASSAVTPEGARRRTRLARGARHRGSAERRSRKV